MRGLGTSFLIRRAMSTWLMLAAVAVTVLVATVLASALWTFEAEAIPLGTRHVLAASPDRSIAIASAAGQPTSGDAGVIRARLRAAWPGVGYQMLSALWSRPIPLSAAPGNPGTTEIQAAALQQIQAQAVLTAGSWPGPPRPHAPLPVALPVTVARQLHLRPGTVLKAASHAGATALGLRVTGLFRPRNPAAPYWTLDLLPVSGIRALPLPFAGAIYGPAVVSPAAFSDRLATNQSSWSVLPQAAALARGNIGVLAASTSQAATELTVFTRPYGLQVATGLPRLLSDVNRSTVLARSLFTICALQLLLVTAAGLALAARLLAGHREEESALLRARGATKWEITRPGLAEALGLGVLAAVVGVPAGARLAARLAGGLAGLGRLRPAGYPAAGIAPLAWVSAFAVLALCVVVMAWPGLRSASPDAARAGRSRQARLAGIAWVGGDLALVAIAVLAVWELRSYSAVARPVSGKLGIDPVVALAPALALAGVALIPLRALPLLARLTDKATERGRRLAAAIVSWQIGRRPVRQAGPVLLAVVAAATSTLALAGYASWHRSAADQAAYAVGADVRLDSLAPAPLGEGGAIAGAPGVTATTPASVVTLGSGGSGGQMLTISGTPSGGPRLIALDASSAGATIALRHDLSPLPLAALWRRITPRRLGGLPIPGRPARLEVLVSLATEAAARELGGAGVIAWLQDGGGGTYQLGTCRQPVGYLPADGRQHALIIPLSPSGQAIRPLRLLGLSLCLTLPPFDAARPSASPALLLRVLSLAAARANTGQFGAPFAHGAALASWRAWGSSPSVPARPPGSFGGPVTPQDGTPPKVQSWHGAAAGSQELGFTAGHAPSPKVTAETSTFFSTEVGQVTIMARPPFPAIPPGAVQTIIGNTPTGGATQHVAILPGLNLGGVPAIATNSYLTGNHVRIGSTVPFSVDGALVPIRIVASVTAFPTTPPGSRVLIADLAAVQDLLAADQVPPLPVTTWWLRTSHGQVPRRLPPGLSTADLARQEAALLHAPLSVAPRQAMLAIGAAAVLLAALGFSVSVAASVRERRTQSAVFAALGVGRRAQAGQLCLEQLVLSVPAAAVGLLAGIGLARLLVPSVTLAANAAAPVPSALVILPLGQAAALALIIAAVPVAAAAVSVARRPDPAAQLRAEAG